MLTIAGGILLAYAVLLILVCWAGEAEYWARLRERNKHERFGAAWHDMKAFNEMLAQDEADRRRQRRLKYAMRPKSL